MYSLLSVLLTKEPSTCAVNLYRANPKTIKNVLTTRVKGCGAFIECVADLDDAHFVTKFDMIGLCEQIQGTKIPGIPLDRLVAAKKLSIAIADAQKAFPLADEVLVEDSTRTTSKCFMPQSTINPPRLGTKSAIQLALLEKGTTITEMAAVLGWKEGSVYSGLNYDLNHGRGFGYRVERRAGMEDFYTLLLPNSYTGPLYAPPRLKKGERMPLEMLSEEELKYA